MPIKKPLSLVATKLGVDPSGFPTQFDNHRLGRLVLCLDLRSKDVSNVARLDRRKSLQGPAACRALVDALFDAREGFSNGQGTAAYCPE